MGSGGVSFPEKNVTKLQCYYCYVGWVGVKFPGKKRYVTLEWPLTFYDYSKFGRFVDVYYAITKLSVMWVNWLLSYDLGKCGRFFHTEPHIEKTYLRF